MTNNSSRFIKTTVIIDNNNKSLVNLNATNSLMPILKSNINVYDYDEDNFDDDDVDLEYVEDDTCDEGNYESKSCHQSAGAPGPAVSTPCQNCMKHKKQIDLLIEKQINNEKEMIRLKNDFEIKLLNKSLEMSYSSTPGSPVKNVSKELNPQSDKSTSTSPFLSRSSSGTDLDKNKNDANSSNNNDWIKYFSSRPQAKPPK